MTEQMAQPSASASSDRLPARGRQDLRARHRRACRLRLCRARGRVRFAAGAVRLRQVDRAAHRRRLERTLRRHGRMGGRQARRRPHRLRVSGADADALGQCGGQCAAAAQAGARRGGASGRGSRAGAGARRPGRFRRRFPARIVRRHADARLHRPRAGHRAAAAADGRALRRARRDHPLQAQRRSVVAVADARAHGDLRHPFGVRVGLSVAAHRGDDAAPRPGVRRHRYPRALSARRGLSHLGGICRILPRWFPRRSRRRWREPRHERTRAAHRPADPGARAGRRPVGRGGAPQPYPALCAAGARPGVRHARLRRRAADAFAVGDAHHHLRGLRAGGRRRHRPGGPVQPVAPGGIFALSLRGDAAGDAGRRHRAALADLSAAALGGARLRLDRGVLPGARQQHARPDLGRSQSHRPVRTVQGVALAIAVEPETAGGAAADARGPAHCRRAVADRRGGGRDRRRLGRRRLGASLPHRRVRAIGSTSRACLQRSCCCRLPASPSISRWRRSLTWRCAAGTRARSSANARPDIASARRAPPSSPPPRSARA